MCRSTLGGALHRDEYRTGVLNLRHTASRLEFPKWNLAGTSWQREASLCPRCPVAASPCEWSSLPLLLLGCFPGCGLAWLLREPKREARPGPGSPGCSLECKLIAENANDPSHLILLTDALGAMTGCSLPVTTAALIIV